MSMSNCKKHLADYQYYQEYLFNNLNKFPPLTAALINNTFQTRMNYSAVEHNKSLLLFTLVNDFSLYELIK